MSKAGLIPAFDMRKFIGLGREPTLVKSPADFGINRQLKLNKSDNQIKQVQFCEN